MKPLLLPLIAWLTAASAAYPAAAGDLRPGIIGGDDRVRIERDGAPWEAIGHVNIGGYRRSGACTGTLVAPDLVLTAAHCVVDRVTRAPFPLRDIHYVAGVRRSANKGHATAKCLRFLNSYEFTGPSRTGSMRSALNAPVSALFTDVAVIVLATPLAVEPAVLGDTAPPHPETPLVHAAYPADRRFVLSAHEGCRRLPSPDGVPLWITDCDTHPASSGGPVFARTDAGLKLIAIMVATGSRQANVALPISQWRGLVQDAHCP